MFKNECGNYEGGKIGLPRKGVIFFRNSGDRADITLIYKELKNKKAHVQKA